MALFVSNECYNGGYQRSILVISDYLLPLLDLLIPQCVLLAQSSNVAL